MPTEALTTLASAKTFLGESGATYDTLLGDLLDGVEAAVGRFCRPYERDGTNHPLASYSGTEYYSGDGMAELWLRRFPVTAITSVHVDQNGYFGHGTDAFDAASEWTIGTDFVPNFDLTNLRNIGGLLSLRKHASAVFNAAWPIGRGNVKVVYTAGYATIPDDLVLAVHMLLAQAWAVQKSETGHVHKSERHSRYAYELLTTGTSQQVIEARGILLGYKDKRG